jgi:hypothetical protein
MQFEQLRRMLRLDGHLPTGHIELAVWHGRRCVRCLHDRGVREWSMRLRNVERLSDVPGVRHLDGQVLRFV